MPRILTDKAGAGKYGEAVESLTLSLPAENDSPHWYLKPVVRSVTGICASPSNQIAYPKWTRSRGQLHYLVLYADLGSVGDDLERLLQEASTDDIKAPFVGLVPLRFYIAVWTKEINPQAREGFETLMGWMGRGVPMTIHYWEPSTARFPIPRRIDRLSCGICGGALTGRRQDIGKGLGI